MSAEEIKELLDLKSWDTARLASELGMTQAGVDRWFMEEKAKRLPRGPAVKLMQMWLTEARAESSKNGKREKVKA